MQQLKRDKATKYPIIENKALRGGLKTTLQRYSIFYLFPIFNEDNTIKYDPKISIEHFIEKKEVKEQRPSSLRFNNSLFLKEFIMELIRSLAFFEKTLHKDIVPYTQQGEIFYKNKIINLLQEVNDNYKKILLEK